MLMDFSPVWVSSSNCDLEATLKERSLVLFLANQAIRTSHRGVLSMHAYGSVVFRRCFNWIFWNPLQECCHFKVTSLLLLMSKLESTQGCAI